MQFYFGNSFERGWNIWKNKWVSKWFFELHRSFRKFDGLKRYLLLIVSKDVEKFWPLALNVNQNYIFPNFSCNPNYFFCLSSNCSFVLDLRNLHEAFYLNNCIDKFTVWRNCSSDLKLFANTRPSAFEFQKFLSITRTNFSPTRSQPFWKQNIKPLFQLETQ